MVEKIAAVSRIAAFALALVSSVGPVAAQSGGAATSAAEQATAPAIATVPAYGPPPPPTAVAPESVSDAAPSEPAAAASGATARAPSNAKRPEASAEPTKAASAASASAPSSAASAAVPAESKKNAAPVRLAEGNVFTLRVAAGGKSAAERARLASKALASAVEDARSSEVKVVRQGDVALIYAGPNLVVQLYQDDARAAGDSSLDVHAGLVASAVHQALESERQRSRVAKNVFSLSLVVFFALIAFYVARKLAELADRARAWLERSADRSLTLRVQRIELVTPAVLKSTLLVGLSLARLIGQFGIFYAWLVGVLSLFESTRGYTERLTGFVLSPFSQLMERLARALPLLVVAAIAALSVFVLVRFVGLFFAGVARRETALTWLPPDLAAPTSVLLRIAIVLAALVFLAPVVTGDNDGALGRAGSMALVAVGLAGIPLIASGLVGAVILFGRRLRVGEHVELDGNLGRIAAINLLELRMETYAHEEIRVPHLYLLHHSLKGLGARPRLSVDLAVDAEALPARVMPLLDEAAGRVGRDVRVEISSASVEGVLYRVSVTCDSLDSRSALTSSLLEALQRAGVSLGRPEPRARRP